MNINSGFLSQKIYIENLFKNSVTAAFLAREYFGLSELLQAKTALIT